MPCQANNGTFASCCPTQGVNPNKDMCTLLLCLGGLLIRDGCLCCNIKEACDRWDTFAMTGFTALPGMCDMVRKCCVDNGTTTTNIDWDFCMLEAQEAGNFTLPDLATLIPSGLLVFDGDGSNTNAAAGSSSKYAMNTGLALIGLSLTFLFV
jgi:hypothetical protein